jgi:hypothetical protein
MAKIEGKCREVVDKAEWVCIGTSGIDGPNLVGTWGDYVRALGIRNDEIVLVPAAGYYKAEENIAKGSKVELLWATRAVEGTYGPGKGCKIRGTGEFQTSGEFAEETKQKYPFARAVLVVKVEEVIEQL